MATEYCYDIRGPHFIEQGSSSTIEMPIYRGASLATPSAGTVAIFDGSGTTKLAATAVTATNPIATYEIAGSVTTDEPFATDWWCVWTLTVSGEDVVVRNRAILCLYLPPITVSNATILRREPTFNQYPRSWTSWQPVIEDVHYSTLVRLLEEGKDPHKISTPYSLHDYQLFTALAIIAELQSTLAVGEDRYSVKAERYRAMAEERWNAARFSYDLDEDGDTDATGQPTGGVLFTSMAPQWWRGRIS